MATRTPNVATAEDQPLPDVSWFSQWRTRFHLRIRRIFPTATVLTNVLALLILGFQAWIYNEQRKLMNDTLRINGRAYVGVASISSIKDGQVIIMLENIGRIPADKINVEITERRRTEEWSHGSTFPFDSGQQLFPGSLKMRIVVPLSFESKEIDDINAKTEILYISGTIKYDDGFGNNAKTDFGFEYRPPPDDFWTARSELIKK